jgi:hypothetical protein
MSFNTHAVHAIPKDPDEDMSEGRGEVVFEGDEDECAEYIFRNESDDDPDRYEVREAESTFESFSVTIDLGNAAMRNPEHVIDALRRVATMMEGGAYEGTVMDNLGNSVGTWRFA